MAETLVRPPPEYLRKESEDAGAALRALQNLLLAAEPLDNVSREPIVKYGLTSSRFEDPFKIHPGSLLGVATPMAALRQVVTLSLGAPTPIFQHAHALEWLDDLDPEHTAKQRNESEGQDGK